jgi:hypothetical protein
MTDEIPSLRERIDKIESGYEFLLAYAAQGRETDKSSGAGQNVREFLKDMKDSLNGLGTLCKEIAKDRQPESADDYMTFLDAVESDAIRADGLLGLVLAQEKISSQLIDNLNANVHLRTLLTDLFIIDDILG